MILAAYIGFFEIVNNYRQKKKLSSSYTSVWEGVTIIRPIKGIDPELFDCLKSSFDQDYPLDNLQILFCIQDPLDQAIPLIKDLISMYPHIDSKIILSSSLEHYGPNPKVNNLVKGFINAKNDILWIMDSNVYASPLTLKNSIITLNENLNNGKKLSSTRPVRLVHHVPLALSFGYADSISSLGSRLDEMFLLTSHSKFYISLNKLSIGACVNGKSNLYRRSDLDKSVDLIKLKKSSFFSDPNVINDSVEISNKGKGHSIEFFSRYIGEDNMIAISLWDNLYCRTGQTSDLVVQPLSGFDNTVKDYINRRVRWLRVRKYMVMMATLIEPTTESIVCGLIGNFAIAHIFTNKSFLPYTFLFHMLIWVITDYHQYYMLIDNISNYDENNTTQPNWLNNIPQKSLIDWLKIWILREILALPIWIIAMAGHEIDWRGKPFKIKKDLTAEEL